MVGHSDDWGTHCFLCLSKRVSEHDCQAYSETSLESNTATPKHLNYRPLLPFTIYMLQVFLLDAIHYLTHGAISLPLTRYILVDIDDIFVGEARMVKSDVLALADSQKQINKLCPGFKYNLGR